MARQIASVAPVHVARQCGHAGGPSQRCTATAMTWPLLSRHAGWRDKANILARAGLFSPTLPFFPSLLPDQSNSRSSLPAAPPPRSLQIRPWGGSWGKRSPPFSEVHMAMSDARYKLLGGGQYTSECDEDAPVPPALPDPFCRCEPGNQLAEWIDGSDKFDPRIRLFPYYRSESWAYNEFRRWVPPPPNPSPMTEEEKQEATI
ncbi:uncharacterized protein LOC120705992 [Panicum virgatum]|uniref:uncharacterized protein LOC120705992 n=1 Tax=Panicum virgatum TaxID=38727 RepID=UPI0019D59267|nr:uncharacterized protein LOC120705992 [Panicum virgatum]